MTRGERADAWQSLRARTPARVALGRAGTSLPTGEVLRFAMDHAEARDAVHTPIDFAPIADAIAAAGRSTVRVASRAADRADYLLNPDRGRRLDEASADRLASFVVEGVDVAVILGDGLSATAAHRHGLALLDELVPRLSRYRLGPVVLAERSRVGLQDEIGRLLRAKCAVIVLGERPGLGAADSLGAYLVFDPGPGKTDADRNCVSNIRPAGLPLAAAADTLAYLIDAALSRHMSGVNLKDDRPRILA